MRRWDYLRVGLILLAVMGVVVLHAPDWQRWLRPSVLHLLHGQPAYGGTGFYNPPWTALPLAPIALLPAPLDRLALSVIALMIYARLAIGSFRPPSSSQSGSGNSNG